LLKPGYRSRLAFDTYGGLDLFSDETPADFDEAIRSIGDEKAMNTLAILSSLADSFSALFVLPLPSPRRKPPAKLAFP
jgi:hypothetical protein